MQHGLGTEACSLLVSRSTVDTAPPLPTTTITSQSLTEIGPLSTAAARPPAQCRMTQGAAWYSRARIGNPTTHFAMAYSATTVLPAEVCAETSTDLTARIGYTIGKHVPISTQ